MAYNEPKNIFLVYWPLKIVQVCYYSLLLTRIFEEE